MIRAMREVNDFGCRVLETCERKREAEVIQRRRLQWSKSEMTRTWTKAFAKETERGVVFL